MLTFQLQGLYMLQLIAVPLFVWQHPPENGTGDTHLHCFLSCADSRSSIINMQNIPLYFRNRRSWRLLLATRGDTLPCSHNFDGYLQMCCYLGIVNLDKILGPNSEPPQPNRTWNAYRLALGLSTWTQQLHSPQLNIQSIQLYWHCNSLNVVTDWNHLWELRNSI
jgi:hypothetical protein